jgi:hypothetical protein
VWVGRENSDIWLRSREDVGDELLDVFPCNVGGIAGHPLGIQKSGKKRDRLEVALDDPRCLIGREQMPPKGGREESEITANWALSRV